MAAAPLRVGILHDMDPAPPGRPILRRWLEVAVQTLVLKQWVDGETRQVMV